jgi:exonuclease SbcC
MRPVRVVMQAFGPYARTQVVDFRELRENRFFLIHGPTGSGKTTVLDAMCYALYGTTTGAERTAEEMRSQFADAALPTEVVFDFAIGEDLYRVRRRPGQQRAKARGTGTTSVPAEATLWKRAAGFADGADGIPVAVKGREVDAEVRRIIGFDADQFRQVVMLPQGRFRELLSADSKKREDIMQALFATRRYAAIEERLKERKRTVQTGIEDARKLSAETLLRAGVAGAEELSELALCARADLEAAIAGRDVAQERARSASAALDEGRLAARRLAAVTVAEGALARAEADLASCELSAGEAAAALAVEEKREPERAAAAEAVRALAEVERACVELEVTGRAVEAATSERERRAAQVAEAAARLEATRSALVDLRATAHDASAAAADAVRSEAAFASCAEALEAAEHLVDLDRRVREAQAAHQAAAADGVGAAERAAAADAERETMLLRWREGRAAALAVTLRPGVPCPVCGSTEHPRVAAADVAPPTDEGLAAAEAAVRDAIARATKAASRAAASDAALAALVAERTTLGDAGASADIEGARSALETARTARDAAVVRARVAEEALARVGGLAAAETELKAALDAATTGAAEADRALAVAITRLEAAEKSVPADLREPGAAAAALVPARLAEAALKAAYSDASARARDAGVRLAGAQATRRERVAALEAVRIEAAGVVAPDLPALEAVATEAATARDAAVGQVARQAQDLAACESDVVRLAELNALSGELMGRFETIAAISDAATGSNAARLSFQRYVLGVFLTDVLESATRRLEIMTRGRYRLHMAAGPRDGRRAGGLDLEVFDEYTGEDRPVGTLSGGEGFLASLALALGLAEVVESLAGGVHLDTVFIDEGFGTLDEEALETAIDALMQLQGRSRLVGIISHVTELQAVVPARLEVTSTPQGSTARFIVP